MQAVLEISGLKKRYAESDFALTDVSFSVPQGSIVGFVGENGAGKTTTISAVLNTIRRDAGEILLFGQKMTEKNPQLREDIGVVFDAPNFSLNITPQKLGRVMEGLYCQWDAVYYDTLLTRFALPTGKKLKSFSRGMQMKLAIAAALAHRPKLLILDEATSGLDPIVREEILDVFLDFVGDEQHAILLSSHITSDLEKIADYITFIHNGATLMTVPKDELRYGYGVARCKAQQFAALEQEEFVAFRKRDYQIDVLVQDKKAFEKRHTDIVVDNVGVDEIMLLLVKGER